MIVIVIEPCNQRQIVVRGCVASTSRICFLLLLLLGFNVAITALVVVEIDCAEDVYR